MSEEMKIFIKTVVESEILFTNITVVNFQIIRAF